MGYLTKSSSVKQSAEIFFIPSSWLLRSDYLFLSVLKSSRRIFCFSELSAVVLGTLRRLKIFERQIGDFLKKCFQPNKLKKINSVYIHY